MSGFPTGIISGNFEDRRFIESSPYQGNVVAYDNSTPSSINGNAAFGSVPRNTTIAGTTIQPTRRVFVESLEISCKGQVTLLVPSAPTLTGSTSGGTLAAGTYRVAISGVNTSAETILSQEATVTTTGSTSSITVAYTIPYGVSSVKIWVKLGAGNFTQYFTDATGSFTITTATGTAGVPQQPRCGIDLNVQIADAGNTPSAQSPFSLNKQLNPGDAITIPLRTWYTEGTSFLLVTNGVTGSNIGSFYVTLSLNVTSNCTNDQHYGARYTWLHDGDSISNSTGPAMGADFFHFKCRDRYRNGLGITGKNIDLRLVSKGNGGYAIANSYNMDRRQWDEVVGTPSVMSHMLGTNDAVAYVTPANRAAILANYVALITSRINRYPGVPYLVIGPPPRQDSNEAGNVALRADLVTAVAAFETNYPGIVRYCDASLNFDRTNNANYTDGTGTNGIHPSAAGHAIIEANVYEGLQQFPNLFQ